MRLHDYDAFEKCVAEIFNLSGYDVQTNITLEDGQREIDIVATKDKTQGSFQNAVEFNKIFI